jgi:hypothetical protein
LGKSREEVTRIHVHPISNDNVYAHGLEFPVSIAEKLIEELEKDPKIRRRLAELMVTDSDVRLAIVNAVLADVATKKDLEKLEERLDKVDLRAREQSQLDRGEVGKARRPDGPLREALHSDQLPTLIAVIGILLRMIFS